MNIRYKTDSLSGCSRQIINYTITYNQDCTLSLYYDRYEFLGGAHGNTLRCSDTWHIPTGCRIMLWQLFPRSVNSRAYVIRRVNQQIAAQIQAGDNDYFDDYTANVAKHFDPDSFYAAPHGLVVYFQQYEIAPLLCWYPRIYAAVFPYRPAAAVLITVHVKRCHYPSGSVSPS